MSTNTQYETNTVQPKEPRATGGYMLAVRIKIAPAAGDTAAAYPVILDTSPLTVVDVPLTLTYFYNDPILGTINITNDVSNYLEITPVIVPPTAVPVTWPPPLATTEQGIPLYSLLKLPPYSTDTVARFSINIYASDAGNSPTSNLF